MSALAVISGEQNPIISAGVLGLHALFSQRAVTPVEVCDAYLDRIHRLNDGLKCYVQIDEVGARSAAAASAARWAKGEPLSLLDGIPIAVKANIAVRGLRWTAALKLFEHRVAQSDARVVADARAAGCVVLGLVNMHEAALGATTNSPLFGPAFNPLAPGYTPGGSSGGSAAAVAAGLAAWAFGTDTMGSVRIPSAYCGVFGYKPSRGLVSLEGVQPLSFLLDHVGIHARTAHDGAALADVVWGGKRANPKVDQTSCRVGVLNCSGVDLEPAVRSAFDNAVQAISRAGFAVQGCALPGYDFAAMRRKGLLVCEAELAASLGEDAHAPNAISPELASLLAFADRQSATKLAQCYLAFRTLDAPLHALFESVDVIVTPTAPQRAFPHSQSAPANQADLTALANLAGLPAATLPLPIANDGGGDGGLPVGLHMMAPRGRDDMLLQLARRFSDICGQT